MPKIFISYRRADSRAFTERIHDRLVLEFGRENVFLDVDKQIPPGSEFADILKHRLDETDVLLVIIGRFYAQEINKRLDTEDFVRMEVGRGLDRIHLVIPLLVDGGEVPVPDDLPPEMRGLLGKNALPIRPNPDFHEDMTTLAKTINKEFPQAPKAEKPASVPLRWLITGTIATLFLAGLFALSIFMSQQPSGTTSTDTPANQETRDALQNAIIDTEAAKIVDANNLPTKTETPNTTLTVQARVNELIMSRTAEAQLTVTGYTDTPSPTVAISDTPSLTPTSTLTETPIPTDTPTVTYTPSPNATQLQRTINALVAIEVTNIALTDTANSVKISSTQLSSTSIGTNSDTIAPPSNEVKPTITSTLDLRATALALFTLTAEAWTDTPVPTVTSTPTRIPTQTALPTATATASPTSTTNATLTARADDHATQTQVAIATEIFQQAVATENAQLQASMPTITPAAFYGKTKTEVNLRNSPSLDADVLEEIPEGTLLLVYEETGNWYRVKIQNADGTGEKFGWMSASLIDESEDFVWGEEAIFSGHRGAVNSIVFSADGKTLLSGSSDKTLRLWDVEAGNTIRTFTGHTDDVNDVAFSPDGKTVVSASNDTTLRLWDIETGDSIRTFKGHSDIVYAVAFSPDGKTIVSGAEDGSIYLWDVETGEQIRSFEGHATWVRSLAFSPDGKSFVSASGDTTIRLWDVSTGETIHIYEGHTRGVDNLAFSMDGTLIVSGSWDDTVKLWDTESGKLLHTFEGHTSDVLGVALSADNKSILSGSADRLVRLWDIETGETNRIYAGHSFWVISVALSPDGHYAASGGLNGGILLWNLT